MEAAMPREVRPMEAKMAPLRSIAAEQSVRKSLLRPVRSWICSSTEVKVALTPSSRGSKGPSPSASSLVTWIRRESSRTASGVVTLVAASS